MLVACDDPNVSLESDPLDGRAMPVIDMTSRDGPVAPSSVDWGAPDFGLAFPPGPCEIVSIPQDAFDEGIRTRMRFEYGENRLPVRIELFQGEETAEILLSERRLHYSGNLLIMVELDSSGDDGLGPPDGHFESLEVLMHDDQARLVGWVSIWSTIEGVQRVTSTTTWRYTMGGALEEVFYQSHRLDGGLNSWRQNHDHRPGGVTVLTDFEDDGLVDLRTLFQLDQLGRVMRVTETERGEEEDIGFRHYAYDPPARVVAVIESGHQSVDSTRYVLGSFGPEEHEFLSSPQVAESSSYGWATTWTYGSRGEVKQEVFLSDGEPEVETSLDYSCWTLGDDRPGCGVCPAERPLCREGVYCAECDPKDGRSCPFSRPVCLDGWCYEAEGRINRDGEPESYFP